jgi:hypothetical protein
VRGLWCAHVSFRLKVKLRLMLLAVGQLVLKTGLRWARFR